MRRYTYPPDFHYITQEQLRSTMWELAYHSRELNRLVSSPETAQLHRTEIVEQLGAMEQARS